MDNAPEKYDFDKLSAAWHRAEGPRHRCPACGRDAQVVWGIWVQHTNPESWANGRQIEQCRLALTHAVLKEPA